MNIHHLWFDGWGRRTRTFPTWSRARRPTARRSPSDVIESGGAYAPPKSKSSPLPGLLSGIIPSIVAMATPQKRAEIGQLIQSQLSNPLIVELYQALLSNQSTIAQPLLKYQPRHSSYTTAGLYNGATDNGKETVPLAAPPTLRGTIPRSADETDRVMAPLTLPESVTEVAPC